MIIGRNRIIAAAAIAVLLVGGGILVFGGNNKDKNSENNNQSSKQNSQFTPFAGSYSATITSSVAGKLTSTSTIAVKDTDTFSITSTGDSGNSKFIVDGKDLYLQSNDEQWIKYPSSQGATAAPSLAAFTGYLQSADAFARYSGASDKGNASCSIGSCKLYEYNDPNSKDKVSIYVDTSHNNRIVEIVTKLTNSDENKVTYNYSTSVDIQIPTNATSISVPGQ